MYCPSLLKGYKELARLFDQDRGGGLISQGWMTRGKRCFITQSELDRSRLFGADPKVYGQANWTLNHNRTVEKRKRSEGGRGRTKGEPAERERGRTLV